MAADFVPEAFYLDYAFNVPTDIMTSHTRAIVHPEANVDLAAAQAAGTTVYAYLSVGELGKNAPHRAAALALELPLRGQNPIWESDLLDLRDGRWADFLVNTVAKSAVDQGFGGFFLDTLDSIELNADAAETEAQRSGLIQLITQLKNSYPALPIIVNRGFDTLPALEGIASGLMVESVFAAYDFEGNFYRPTDASITADLLIKMDEAIALGFEVYALDYADPADPVAALAAAQRILDAGYHAFVSTPELEGEALGPWQPLAPLFITEPQNITVRPDQPVTLQITFQGEPTPTVTWLRNGVPLDGAVADTLVLSEDDLVAGTTSSYQVRLDNRAGTAITQSFSVAVDAAALPGRLSNLSARTWAGTGDAQLTPGVVSEGAVDILVRAVGPTLADFEVTDPLADPRLSVVGEGHTSLFNDNWQDGGLGAVLSSAAATVGAFPLRESSADAALSFTLNGVVTLPVEGAGETGTALVEVYALDVNTASGTLTNLSTRAVLREEDGGLIVGFVLAGDAASQVLVRAVGPGLAGYGVPGALSDPTVEVFGGSISLAKNNDWNTTSGQTARIRSTSAQVGAFDLEEGSADAALLLTLPPGVYTVVVRGRGEAPAGIVLAEVYRVP